MKKSFVKWKRMLAGGGVIILAGGLLFSGYLFSWTGFRGKTLWDWLGLLATFAIPVVVGFGVAWYTRTQQRRDQQLADQRDASERVAAEKRAQTEREISTNSQREIALQTYIDKLSELIISYNLRLSQSDSAVRAIARSRTLTMLRGLDVARKANLLQFLYESGLISKGEHIIDLSGADLSGVILDRANLRKADLRGANLQGAKLVSANLSEADLSEADLSEADLQAANLDAACLQRAYLIGTNLESAHLNNANLQGSHLQGAILAMACLERANLSETIMSGASLFCAYLPEADLNNAFLGEFNRMVGADLSGAILWNACLNKASLNDSYLITTDLREASLEDASLEGAELIVADLRGARLERVNLTGAFLNGAVVTKEQLAKVSALTGAVLPDNQKVPEDAYPKDAAPSCDTLLPARVARAVRLRESGYTRQLKHPSPIHFASTIDELLEMVKEPASEQTGAGKRL